MATVSISVVSEVEQVCKVAAGEDEALLLALTVAIDDLARRLAGAVPENVSALRRDLEQNFKGVLQSQLARLDLVTREEFDGMNTSEKAAFMKRGGKVTEEKE